MAKPKLSVRPPPVDPALARQFIATGDIYEPLGTPVDTQERLQTSESVQENKAATPSEASLAELSQPLAEVRERPQTSAIITQEPHTEAHPELIPPPKQQTATEVRERSQTSVDTQRKRAAKGTKVLVEREGGRVRRRMTVYLPPELADQFMAWCSSNGREASHAVAEALTAFLKARRGK